MSIETNTFRLAPEANVVAQMYASTKDVWKDAGLPLENEKGQAYKMNTCPPGHKKVLDDYKKNFPGSDWLDKLEANKRHFKWPKELSTGKHLVPVVVRCGDSNLVPYT